MTNISNPRLKFIKKVEDLMKNYSTEHRTFKFEMGDPFTYECGFFTIGIYDNDILKHHICTNIYNSDNNSDSVFAKGLKDIEKILKEYTDKEI